MTKEKAIEAVKAMPKDFDLEQLIEKLIVIEKVEAGIKQVEQGHVTPHNDVKKIVDGWRK